MRGPFRGENRVKVWEGKVGQRNYIRSRRVRFLEGEITYQVVKNLTLGAELRGWPMKSGRKVMGGGSKIDGWGGEGELCYGTKRRLLSKGISRRKTQVRGKKKEKFQFDKVAKKRRKVLNPHNRGSLGG